MPLDFTSCYYQSSLLSFTSIAQIFQSGQSQHCWACTSIPTILFMWTLVLSCVCVCTNRCLCTTSSLYVQSSAQNCTTTQSKQISQQASVTFLDLPIQNGDSSALVFTSSHPIPSAIAKYTPYEPYTTYFDRPFQSTVLHDCTNPTSSVKHRPTMRAEPTKCWFVSNRKQARRA